MTHWPYLLILAFVVFVFYRRSFVRKAGAAVGRAKAAIPKAKPGKQISKPETGIGRDYSALDLKPGASFDDVKRAYRELAKVWHPDRFGNDKKLLDRANSKLGEINAAYERLKNHFGK